MKKINLAILLMLSLNCLAQQSVNDKIKQFESNFKNWENAENTKKWTLKERMKYYDVNAVSIAVIKDYKIVLMPIMTMLK